MTHDKGTIIASIDKLTLNFRLPYYWFLSKYFDIYSPLWGYDFKRIPSRFLAFQKVSKVLLYTDKDLEKDPSLFYRYKYLIVFRDQHGRQIVFKHRRFDSGNLSSISIEFIPTIRDSFDYHLVLKIFEKLNLNYRHFHPSNIEHNWDFHGDCYESILNCIWTKSNKLLFIYKEYDGEIKQTNNPEEIPMDNNYTIYVGQRYKYIYAKGYTKREFDFTFNRVEVDVCRGTLKNLGIYDLDDLSYAHGQVTDHIFNSFCLAKFNRKKFTEIYPESNRLFNRLKSQSVKHKFNVMYQEYGQDFKSFADFKNKFMKKMRLTETCKTLLEDHYTSGFFANIPEDMKRWYQIDYECKRRQTQLELKIKASYEDQVKQLCANALADKSDYVFLPLRKQILDRIESLIRKNEITHYAYMGLLNNLVNSMQRVTNKLRRDREEKRKKLLSNDSSPEDLILDEE